MKKTLRDSHNYFVKFRFGKTLDEMSNKELGDHYREMDISINDIECYSPEDIMMHSILDNELGKRSIEMVEGSKIFISADGEEIE